VEVVLDGFGVEVAAGFGAGLAAGFGAGFGAGLVDELVDLSVELVDEVWDLAVEIINATHNIAVTKNPNRAIRMDSSQFLSVARRKILCIQGTQ